MPASPAPASPDAPAPMDAQSTIRAIAESTRLDDARALIGALFVRHAPALSAADIADAWNSGAPDFLILSIDAGAIPASTDARCNPLQRMQRAESIIARSATRAGESRRASVFDCARIADDARAHIERFGDDGSAQALASMMDAESRAARD